MRTRALRLPGNRQRWGARTLALQSYKDSHGDLIDVIDHFCDHKGNLSDFDRFTSLEEVVFLFEYASSTDKPNQIFNPQKGGNLKWWEDGMTNLECMKREGSGAVGGT